MTNEPEISPVLDSFVSIAKMLESLDFSPDLENGGWWWKHQQNIIVVRFLDSPQPHVSAVWLNEGEKLHDQTFFDFEPTNEAHNKKKTRDVLKFVSYYQGRSEPTGLKFPESKAA